MTKLNVKLVNVFWPYTKCKQVNFYQHHSKTNQIKGYRHIILRNVGNQNEGPASVFVKIELKVAFPAVQKEVREQLQNPLENVDKRKNEVDSFVNPLKSSGKKRRDTRIDSTEF